MVEKASYIRGEIQIPRSMLNLRIRVDAEVLLCKQVRSDIVARALCRSTNAPLLNIHFVLNGPHRRGWRCIGLCCTIVADACLWRTGCV